MNGQTKIINLLLIMILLATVAYGQNEKMVKLIKSDELNKVDIHVGGKYFTSFRYPDSIEKPFLYPINAANGATITRGFPLAPKPSDPTDHPHHIGLWFNYENVNGLDFWNNSYAIPMAKKNAYGWIRTQKDVTIKNGIIGKFTYHANWTNQAIDILLAESTTFEFSGNDQQRIIDRFTTLTAKMDVTFNDVKDGMLGLRLAHELQIPTQQDEKFSDSKGTVTVVKGGTDKIPTGNYLSSTGKMGNEVWGTRAAWCKAYGKIGSDSISIAIIDHPKNVNYPTFWHARGYGLFAANPLGEKVFTNGKSEKNLRLKKGESITFRYRIVIVSGKQTLTVKEVNGLSQAFGTK